MHYENILVSWLGKMWSWPEDYQIGFSYVAIETLGPMKVKTVQNVAFDFKTWKLLLTLKMSASPP